MPDEQVSTEDNMRYDQPAHTPQFGGPKKKSKKWLVWAAVAIVVLLAAGAAHWFLVANKPEAKKATSTAAPKKAANLPPEPQADATVKTYKSIKLNIEFSYRSDWTFKETADKDEIVLTSPRVTYATKDGLETQGVFTVKLRHGLIPEGMQPAVQNAVAVKDSEVIAYAAPTGEQRHFTNVSFGGKDAQNFSFFIVSGNTGYKAGQPFGGAIDLLGDAYLFVGGYGIDVSDTLAFDEVPVTGLDTEAYQQGIDIIESLKIF